MVTDPPTVIKRAFVTGATGIVGAPLCLQLAEKGVDVIAFSRTTRNHGLPTEVGHVAGDILDPDAIENAARGCDVVFHVAAAVHGSASSYPEFQKVNVQGTENVINVAQRLGAKLIHVSTVNVAGFRSGRLADSYAATKSEAEELVEQAVADGLNAVIVRPATVFGTEIGRAGLLIDRLLTGTLKILPAPARRISPVWSEDLAVALIRAAEVSSPGKVFTVAGPTLTTGEFVKRVCEAAGTRRPIVSIPGWMFAVPLQLAWWGRGLTRWTPPVTVEALMNGSAHDGHQASEDLGFQYTAIGDIFGS
jgi:dihydroflavonol-4-reductase